METIFIGIATALAIALDDLTTYSLGNSPKTREKVSTTTTKPTAT
jgi:hypothetical protein